MESYKSSGFDKKFYMGNSGRLRSAVYQDGSDHMATGPIVLPFAFRDMARATREITGLKRLPILSLHRTPPINLISNILNFPEFVVAT